MLCEPVQDATVLSVLVEWMTSLTSHSVMSAASGTWRDINGI